MGRSRGAEHVVQRRPQAIRRTGERRAAQAVIVGHFGADAFRGQRALVVSKFNLGEDQAVKFTVEDIDGGGATGESGLASRLRLAAPSESGPHGSNA